MRRILLTGASGLIGQDLARLLPREGESWRFADIRPFPLETAHETLEGDLTDMDFALAACEGVDEIVHMAGQPREKPWNELYGPNMIAVANLWEAARVHGVRRVIFGSSNHATGLYPAGRHLTGCEPARPDSRYGVTKVFGEALAGFYADKFGISGFSIRIGTYRATPSIERELATWVSPTDLAALVRVGLEADYHNEVVYGVSGNSRSWWDNSRAFALGYAPQDNAEDYRDSVIMADPAAVGPATLLQGSGHAGREFAGDLDYLLETGKPA